MQLGNGRWESTSFNSRLQPMQIALGVLPGQTNLLQLDYGYGTTQNNGNVLTQAITVPGLDHPFIQNYTYDPLNRLQSAVEAYNGSNTWKQTFTFDRYGNRRFDFTNINTTFPDPNCTEAICNPTISTSNNRLTSTGWDYDASGNTIADPEGRTFTYDAENKQVQVLDSREQQIGEFFYDGDGKRVKKVVPATGEVTVFVYDAGAKFIAEYSTIVQPVNEAKVQYLTQDYLGSPRINTDANGAVAARHDLHPYGEEISTALRSQDLNYEGDDVRRKFTVYQRDDELDLDYARLRMYSNKLGRFMSVDPVAPDIYTPPSLNRYQYCLNNPGRFIDAGGGYDEEVHRDLTAALALAVGFSQEQANVIGAADQWLDDPRSGHTAMSFTLNDPLGYASRRDYHFTTEERRNELWNTFSNAATTGGDAYSALGTYLHAQQDSFSHEGFGPWLGQGYALPENFDPMHPVESLKRRYDEMAKYDKTTFDPEKAIRMARDTFSKLLQARNLMAASGRFGQFRKAVPFGAIESKVREWATTEGRDEKRKILYQIQYIVLHYYDSAEGAGAKKTRKKKTKTTVRIVNEE